MLNNLAAFIRAVELALSEGEAWENQIEVESAARRRLQDDISLSMRVLVEEQYLDGVQTKAGLESTWTTCEQYMRDTSLDEFSSFTISQYCINNSCTDTGEDSEAIVSAGVGGGSSDSGLVAILATIIGLGTCCAVVVIGYFFFRKPKVEDGSINGEMASEKYFDHEEEEHWSETETDTGDVSEIGDNMKGYDMEIEQALQNVPHFCDMKNKIISLIVQLSRLEAHGRADMIPQWIQKIDLAQKELHNSLTAMFGEDRMAEYSDRFDELWDTARVIATQTNIPKRGVDSSSGMFFEIFDYRCHNNLNRDEFAAAARIIHRGVPEDDIDVLFNLIDSNQQGLFTQEDIQIFMYSSWSGRVEEFRHKLNAFIESHDIEETLDLLKIQYAGIPERTSSGIVGKRFPRAKSNSNSDQEYFGSNAIPPDDDYESSTHTTNEHSTSAHDSHTSLPSSASRLHQLGKRRRNFGRPDISEDSNIGLNNTFEEVFNDHSYETFDIPYRSDSQASSYRKRYPGRSASREPFVNIDSLEPGTNRHQFVDISELTLPSQKRHNLRTPNKPRRRKFSLDTRSAGYPTRYEPSSRPEHRRMSMDLRGGGYQDMAGESDPAEVRKQDPTVGSKFARKKEDPTTNKKFVGFDWDEQAEGQPTDPPNGLGSFFTDDLISTAKRRPNRHDPRELGGGLSSRLGTKRASEHSKRALESDI